MNLRLAIVGRPNVGKSTLFNRLAGRRLALVDDTPGVTRDRRLADGSIGALKFQIVDTAGLEDASGDSLEARMRQQTELAIAQADLILFMIDARAGITPDDKAFSRLLRKAQKPVILIANKFEGKAAEPGYYEAYQLGFGDPIAVSAEHALGLADLHDAIVQSVGPEIAYPEEEALDTMGEIENVEGESESPDAEAEDYDNSAPLKIAVVGRPNAGKSTLINKMIDEERLLTGPEAGITRDSIAVDWEWNGRVIRLFDTAGMRKKARIHEKLEKLSVADGLRAVQFAEVVIILLDATAPFQKQDLQIADLIIREGRAPVIVLNKWDLIEDRAAALTGLREMAQRLLPQVKKLQVVPVSGKTGEGIERLMQTIIDVHRKWNMRISTARLNRWLEGIIHHHPPPAVAGRRIRIKYITQIKTRPPTFVVACSRPENLPASYSRYLINSLGETFDLDVTPIRLYTRKGANPYASKSKT
jgi:GTPase